MIDINAWQARQAVQNRILQTVPSAVLVPVIRQGDEERLVFEVRSSKLRWQPGDVSFPGGGIEDGDATPWHAAVREAGEEMGILEQDISLIGPLDYIESPVGVLVWPYAAYVHTTSFTWNEAEVEQVFTVPIDWFEHTEPETAVMELATRPSAQFPEDIAGVNRGEWKKRRPYQVFVYRYKKFIIWGITAQIIKNFLDIRKAMKK